MTQYNVLKLDRHYFVQGLTFRLGLEDDAETSTLLLYRHPEGDADSPYNTKMMHSCLYDLVQCDDRIKDGDEFVTPHGLFRVYGIHVDQVFELPAEAKARRARLRRLAKRTTK